MIGFLMAILFTMSFICATGIIMYAFYHRCDPVQAKIIPKYTHLIPRFVEDVAGHVTGMRGIFISCVFSASLSAVSASLHAVSGIIYSDYIRPLRLFAHTNANANLSIRVLIFVLGSICAFGTVFYDDLQTIIHGMHSLAGISIGAKFGVFTIGMLYPWANQKVGICDWNPKFWIKTNQMFYVNLKMLGCTLWNYDKCRCRGHNLHKCTPARNSRWNSKCWHDPNIDR